MKMALRFYCLLGSLLFLLSCQGPDDAPGLVGKWQYQRLTAGELKSRTDTLKQVLMESVYQGAVLEFYDDATFLMTKVDSVSAFEGKGTYSWNQARQTLTMEGNVRNSSSDRMTVHVFELSADSLKIGGPEETFVFSRIKE